MSDTPTANHSCEGPPAGIKPPQHHEIGQLATTTKQTLHKMCNRPRRARRIHTYLYIYIQCIHIYVFVQSAWCPPCKSPCYANKNCYLPLWARSTRLQVTLQISCEQKNFPTGNKNCKPTRTLPASTCPDNVASLLCC